MNYIYIDANVYLKFYLGNKLFKVLQTLADNKVNIIVTEQIVDEVFRNSVSVNINNLTITINNLHWNKPSIPFKSVRQETNLLIENTYNQYKELKTQIEADIDNFLNLVSTHKDEVTLKLKELFEEALQPNREELIQAQKLKTYGNPPGKKADPIGDELSWVQLLNKIRTEDRLIIVTNDRDYASLFNKKSILNSKLHQELEQKKVSYYVYSEVTEGIKKLKELQEASHSAFEAKDFPSAEEQQTIKEEEQNIIVKKSEEACKHRNISIRPNGVFDDYYCADCDRVVYRQYGDNSD